MTMPTSNATITQLTTMEEEVERQPRETLSPSPMVVLRPVTGHTTWTKRLSKTIQRRSGSFLNTLVPFRKNIDQNQSNVNDNKLLLPSTIFHKRRASDSPIVSMQTAIKGASFFKNEKLSNISVATATTATTGVAALLISSGIQQNDTGINNGDTGNEIYSEEKKKQQQQQQQRKQQQQQQKLQKQQQQQQQKQQQQQQQQRKQHQKV
ncbi:Reticulocyte-binding protein [Dirofilaria immitis]